MNWIDPKQVIISIAIVTGIFLTVACDKSTDEIAITGYLGTTAGMDGKKLYLGDTRTRKFIDSSIVQDGKFSFHLRLDTNFLPFRCSLVLPTGDTSRPHQLVAIKNNYLKKNIESSFYIEHKSLHFTENEDFVPRGQEKFCLIIDNPGIETEVAYRHLSFRSKPEQSEANRKFNIALVRKYPSSVELLAQLDYAKSTLSEEELKSLADMFSEPLKSTQAYAHIASYFEHKNTSGESFPTDVSLKKPDQNVASDILNNDNKYNLVVFWASWCGPCRKEIPQIKSLYTNHKDKLNIVSISTDLNEKAWQKAMAVEKMPWPQFLAADSSLIKLDKKYNLQAIPVWVLFDSKKNLVDRQVEYSEGENSIEKKVEAHLAKK